MLVKHAAGGVNVVVRGIGLSVVADMTSSCARMLDRRGRKVLRGEVPPR